MRTKNSLKLKQVPENQLEFKKGHISPLLELKKTYFLLTQFALNE